MLATEVRNLLNRLDKATEECDGDAIECVEEQCADMLYRVASIVEQYEFLATHVSYMEIDLDGGGQHKVYNDRKNFNDFDATVSKSIEFNSREEDQDD
jgi:hypothetical protein